MIRKTALLVTGTIAGVVGVVSYNPPQLNASIASTGNATQPQASQGVGITSQSTKSSAQPATNISKKSSKKSGSVSTDTSKVSTTVSQTPTEATTQSAGVTGTFSGDTSQTRWGPVQVEIVVTNGKITDISTLQYPNGDRKSLNISNRVIPWLQQETLNIQSSAISGVSGATYTSRGFRDSLASALQKAGM